MSQAASIVISSVCASVVALIATYSLAPQTSAAPSAVADAQLGARFDHLANRLDHLESTLAQREEIPASSPRTAADLPTRAEVRRWVEEALGSRGGGEAVEAAADGGDGFRVESALVELLEVGVNGSAGAEIWARAREAGQVKELIAAFELRAASNPGSAQAQAEVGDAYVQGIVAASDMMTQSTYGQKADAAYGQALELDPNHWHARFAKATGLTYWPDYLGKKAEAIEHFEILGNQQEGLAARPEFRQTWVVLGNLYEQQGKDDEARRAWERGLAQFPNDPELQQKLGR